jgi:hypothetical protein
MYGSAYQCFKHFHVDVLQFVDIEAALSVLVLPKSIQDIGVKFQVTHDI